jgi:hypothetical protein
MVPGHVQGLSRVPPDHHEGGAGGELDSEGLWWRQNIQHPTSNIERLGEATQSQSLAKQKAENRKQE